jgi:glycosyltransferase involved in cell wall biosynthesis
MAAGRAIVASRIGQIPDVIEHNVNGLLCEPGDVVNLTSALQRFVADPGLRLRLGLAARQCVRRKHTWDAVVRRILELARPAGVGV